MKLNEIELDALTEIINIGAGRAAKSLSEITGSRIELSVPNIEVCGTSNFSEIVEKLDLEFSTAVQQGFQSDVSGRAFLVFPERNAFELARIVGGIDATNVEMDDELCGVLEEIGNIVLNAVLGSMANILNCELTYTLPELCTKNTIAKIIMGCADDAQSVVLIADTSFTVASNAISGSLLLLFETGDIKSLLTSLTATPTT